MSTSLQILELDQGSSEWLSVRKKHITATDAPIIMGVNPWKTKLQLYHEKKSDDPPKPANERMQRGIDLEPIARDLFNLKTGWDMKPAVLVKDWWMASLDGRDASSGSILEIKCPGEKDHAVAVAGMIPDHYFPQLQHQMYVSGVCVMYYFSFDGVDGKIVKIKRDEDYIDKMLIEEKKFYDCLISNTPPEPEESDYVKRIDPFWHDASLRLLRIRESRLALDKEEEFLKNQLIYLSEGKNSKGAGISLSQITRKGNIDYSKIPELKDVDLEKFRKESTKSWRITCSE